MKHYLEDIEIVFDAMKSSESGLSTAEAKKRLEANGANKLQEPPKVPLWKKFLLQFADPMIIVLLVAALISFVTAIIEPEGEFADVFIILFVVVMNAVLGVIQENKAEKAIDALKAMTKAKCKVLRDGQMQILNSEELVAGETGIASGYSVEGTLLGHLVKGAMLIDKTAERLGVSHDKAVLLEHMLISHHGDPEFGAAVRPLFIEADILSALDRLDARIVEVNNAVSGVEAGGFSTRQWALDNRAFYNHGRVDVTQETNLGL